jgi:hypothetical protein
LFDASKYAPWPKDGAQVVCTKGDRKFVGQVTLVWMAMDAICIDVLTPIGVTERIFREFGDTCKEI